ncbi:MAG: hybrid sensor histidine kinase/response regulator, partial [Gammaproteobacteria bacterium]
AYGAVILDELFSLPADARGLDRHARPVIIVKEESGARRAILVQEVIDSRDVVVKPLGRYLPKMQGVVGATILGNGSVAPVIDLPELLQKNKTSSRPGASHISHSTQHKHDRLPCVLVVDDSLSARRSLSQFVQDLGMEVRSARDGMEAVAVIEARKPDLVLVDMEMPRMNGLELTSHIRGTPATANIPIIMITSRSSAKHEAVAQQRGVNHFMVKPFAEDELARYMHTFLERDKCNMPA